MAGCVWGVTRDSVIPLTGLGPQQLNGVLVREVGKGHSLEGLQGILQGLVAMVHDGAEIQKRLSRDVTVSVCSEVPVICLFVFSERGFESRLHKLGNEGEKLYIKVRNQGMCEKDNDCGVFQFFSLFCL